MKFHRAWSINITEAEAAFSKRRSSMRTNANSHKLSESFGFHYVKSEYELKKLVQLGRLENGNCSESCLATASMGVSLSQHADLYHPESPKSGVLIVVKYLKGRVHYLPCDSNPMDPQPNYDCHIARNVSSSSTNNDATMTTHKAYLSSQVFIYQFNEDGDIERCPAQMLMIGAIQFSWHGGILYKPSVTSRKEASEKSHKRPNPDATESSQAKRPHLMKPKHVGLIGTTVPTSVIHYNPALPQPQLTAPSNAAVVPHSDIEIVTSTLIVGDQSAATAGPYNSLRVKLMSRLKHLPMIRNL